MPPRVYIGIGKSRIAQTIVERLGSEPHTRLRYFCSPHYQDSALYPSIAQLERAAGFRREDTAEQRLTQAGGSPRPGDQ
jgi:predicted ATPase